MNIEESKSLLGWVSLNKLYIDTHNECDYHNIHTAIETLLTAYEKEKEKNKELIKQHAIEITDVGGNSIKIDLDGKIHNVYKLKEE